MTIIYPEAKPSNAGVMNAGSALFPGRDTTRVRREAKARPAKKAQFSAAWIIAPVAVLAIGGGAYLLATTPHGHPAGRAHIRHLTTTTTAATAAPVSKVATAPEPAKVVAPVQTARRQVVAPTIAGKPAIVHHVIRATAAKPVAAVATAASRDIAAPDATAPAAPIPYSAIGGATGTTVAQPAAVAAPAAVTPAPAIPAVVPAPVIQPATPPTAASTANSVAAPEATPAAPSETASSGAPTSPAPATQPPS